MAGLNPVSQVHSELEEEYLIISWNAPTNIGPNSPLQYDVLVIDEDLNKTTEDCRVSGTLASIHQPIECICKEERCVCKRNFKIIIVPWSPVTNRIENSAVEKDTTIHYVKCKNVLDLHVI